MKNLLFIALSLFALTAQASLISYSPNQTSYLSGGTVVVDLTVNQLNPEAAEFFFDFNFDATTLTFDEFTFSHEVLNTAIFTYADIFLSLNAITIDTIWFDSLDLPSNNFTLGQARFSANQAATAQFEVNNLVVNDANFNTINPQTSVVAVPSPTVGGLLIIALFTLFRLSKRA